MEKDIKVFLNANRIGTDKSKDYRIILTFDMADFSIVDQHHCFIFVDNYDIMEYSINGICEFTYTDIHIVSTITNGFTYDSAHKAMEIMKQIYKIKYYEPN